MHITPSLSTGVFTAGKPYEVFTHPNSSRIGNVIDNKGHLRVVSIDRLGQRCPHLRYHLPLNRFMSTCDQDRIEWEKAGHWSVVV